MADKSDVFLTEDGVELVGSGESPEVAIEGGNHWDLTETDGDLRIGDDENMLKMGVAKDGGGAGNASIWATSKLKLGGSGASVVTIDADSVHPSGAGHALGTVDHPWGGLVSEGNISVYGADLDLDDDSTLNVAGDALFSGKILFSADLFGDLTPESNYNLGAADRRWGTLYVNSIDKSSDRRLKTDIEDFTDGLDAVLDLRPVSYTRRDDGTDTHLGFVGQEVAEVLPETVTVPESDDGYLGLDYTELVPVLVDAIQDQHAETEKLEAQVDRQRERIDEQEERIQDLEERLAALEEAR